MVAIGSQKKLREMEAKIERLQVEVNELSKRIEAQETRRVRIEKIVSLAAEILTIIAGIATILEFLK